MTKVYRVEYNKNTLRGVHDSMMRHLNHWQKLDAPGYRMLNSHVCGVTSLKKLKLWFPGKIQRRIHSNHQLRIVILDVPKIVYKDENQVTFNRKQAKIIGKLMPDGKPKYKK
jgi:hypothetical protein